MDESIVSSSVLSVLVHMDIELLRTMMQIDYNEFTVQRTIIRIYILIHT